ncbi:hypothetical protein [Deinococcus budaensis]|uniref:Uncharacterized protein n=1 Tax=Deinococcus budaensis TaxID=1665626 RepID=A0A7W8GIC5_9DEIO|nr:hypothetical protein [Deinococcus budaensis]MBB5236200.1 hypothetical protein [Deinococcus budaensis]
MKQMRYIITRPCLQEGSLRLLKYLEATFPESGPAQFVDDKGREHEVEIDRAAGYVRGLRPLFHDQNLGVNDVLMITPLAPGRYQVEGIVKPHAPLLPARPEAAPAPEARRVVVTATPHVREVRMQAAPEPSPSAGRAASTPAPAPLVPLTPASQAPQPTPPLGRAPSRAAAPGPLPSAAEDQLAELARLTGYQLSFPAPGVARLHADLGAHGYVVKVALEEGALRTPAWREDADHAALLTGEGERPQGTPRLTREALAALLEHARLAPLSPIDLRPYWQAGDLDLASAASISELVGAHLAQRGAFSFVLLTLAAQPAHSVVQVPRLAERLGSGVNVAELRSILDTLTRAPFLALTPLPGGQYLLRADVGDLLADLAEYADGMRRRVRAPGRPDPATAALALS